MSTTTAKKTTAAACKACTYWKAKAASPVGECRRHAPQTVVFAVDADVKFESHFPVTKASEWCGDFAKA